VFAWCRPDTDANGLPLLTENAMICLNKEKSGYAGHNEVNGSVVVTIICGGPGEMLNVSFSLPSFPLASLSLCVCVFAPCVGHSAHDAPSRQRHFRREARGGLPPGSCLGDKEAPGG
jgi:hypothetical protein